jgi:hypothetical protein
MRMRSNQGPSLTKLQPPYILQTVAPPPIKWLLTLSQKRNGFLPTLPAILKGSAPPSPPAISRTTVPKHPQKRALEKLPWIPAVGSAGYPLLRQKGRTPPPEQMHDSFPKRQTSSANALQHRQQRLFFFHRLHGNAEEKAEEDHCRDIVPA